MKADLAVVTLGGVQRFIGEARSTADAAGASSLLQRMLRVAAADVAAALRESPEPFGLIFPSVGDSTAPVSNKLVFLAPVGDGGVLAEAAAARIRAEWRLMVDTVFDRVDVPETPGMPDTAWVKNPGRADQRVRKRA